MKQRLVLPEVVNVAAFVGGWVTLWQAVRFSQGQIGVPEPFRTMESSLSMMLETSGKLATIEHHIFGTAAWITLSVLVFAFGGVLRHLITDGWATFLADGKAAYQESVRVYELEKARARRRAARSKLNSCAGSGLIPIALGAAIGAWILFL